VASERSPALFWSLLTVGIAVTLVGVTMAMVDIAAALDDEDFTLSLGGLVLGIGLALLLLAAMAERGGRLHPVGSAMVAVGVVVAGWALGGGVDELVRDRLGGFAVAAVAVVLGAALATGGYVIASRS
jgi:peptidoglycan/LPS O-acetylase OafA/YrhL